MAEKTARQHLGIRNFLRQHTHEAHEKLHEHGHFVALFRQTLTLDQYRQLMQRFYGFYVPLEQAIHRALLDQAKDKPEFSYAMRAGLLRQDLVDLGLRDQQIQNAPLCDRLHDIVTPATLGGVLYVIEGSTLGATGIDRAAQKILDHEALTGRRFWAWSRSQSKHRWAMTNAYLEHLNAGAAQADHLAKGARDTFNALAAWLAPLDLDARQLVKEGSAF